LNRIVVEIGELPALIRLISMLGVVGATLGLSDAAASRRERHICIILFEEPEERPFVTIHALHALAEPVFDHLNVQSVLNGEVLEVFALPDNIQVEHGFHDRRLRQLVARVDRMGSVMVACSLGLD